jgi:hypothetical protein
VGRRVPDVALTGADGESRLFEVLAGSPLTLLAVCAAPADEAKAGALATTLRDRPYADLVALHQIWPKARPEAGFSDPAGTLHRLLGARREGVLALVRGDQHLAGVAPLASPAGLLRLLDGLLRAASSGPAGPAAGAGEAATAGEPAVAGAAEAAAEPAVADAGGAAATEEPGAAAVLAPAPGTPGGETR